MKTEEPYKKIKIIPFSEFHNEVIKQLVNEYGRASMNDVFEYFIIHGLPKLEKDNIKSFLSKIGIDVYIEPAVIVDIGDSQFYWLVSGTDAILIQKKD